MKKQLLISIFVAAMLTACSSSEDATSPSQAKTSKIFAKPTFKSSIADPIMAIASLSEHQRDWAGTRYRLGGSSRKGVDCSAFMQITFRDLFGIDLPRTTTEQSKEGTKISKSELQTGDLVFFKTGRGPNGKHVGVYVKDGQFLHASTKGGVIYSDLSSPYWSKTFWQARRL